MTMIKQQKYILLFDIKYNEIIFYKNHKLFYLFLKYFVYLKSVH